jgi:DNA-binding NarL/FixJ family response regulator
MSAPSLPTTPIGLLLSDDMIFTSRITGTARDLGLCMKPARSMEALNALIHRQIPCCVIVDLGHPGLSIVDFMESLGKICSPKPRVVAYGSHVDSATLRSAREAGCHAVLPRSKFVEDLPRFLPDWMQAETESC